MRAERRCPAALQALALIVLSGGPLVHPHPARAAWTQMNGPDRPAAFALGVASEGPGSTILLGSNESDAGDVFRSDDGGLTWTNAGLPNGGVNRFCRQGGFVYAGTYLTGLHRSGDGGATWDLLDSGLSGGEVITGIAGLGSPLLFVATQATSRLYRSTNDGDSWSTIPTSPSKSWTTLAASGTTILAGTTSEGLVRSTDGGASWGSANNGYPASAEVSSILFAGGAVFAAGGTVGQPSTFGVYRSTDNGGSWAKVSADLPSTGSIPALEAQGAALYAGVEAQANNSGLYRSTNGGVNWTRVSGGIHGGPAALSVAFDGSTILMGTWQGVYRSTDDGGTWADSDHGTAAIRGTGSLLRDGASVVVGLETNGDAGRGIWRSGDGGESWAGPGSGMPQNATARALGRAQIDLLAGFYGAGRGVYRSSDGGANWTPSTSGIGAGTIINVIHRHGSVLLTGAWEALYRSTDDGHSWNTVAGMANVNTLVTVGSEIYAGMYGDGVRSSTDGGATWVDASEGLVGSDRRYINSMATHQGALYVGTNGAGVYKRVGSTWVSAGMGTDYVMAMFDAGNSLVAAGALTGVHVTTDGGASWTLFEEGYFGGEVEEMESDGIRLIAGSRGHALWSRPLSDLPQGASVDDGTAVVGTRIERTWPNPARETVAVRYALARSSQVGIALFDPQGREVRRSIRGTEPAGRHEATLDLSDLASGVYFLQFRAGDDVRTAAVRVIP